MSLRAGLFKSRYFKFICSRISILSDAYTVFAFGRKVFPSCQYYKIILYFLLTSCGFFIFNFVIYLKLIWEWDLKETSHFILSSLSHSLETPRFYTVHPDTYMDVCLKNLFCPISLSFYSGFSNTLLVTFYLQSVFISDRLSPTLFPP